MRNGGIRLFRRMELHSGVMVIIQDQTIKNTRFPIPDTMASPPWELEGGSRRLNFGFIMSPDRSILYAAHDFR